MFTPIRAASLDDPRPQLGDGAVLTAAVKLVLPSFVEWTKARGLDLTDEQITFAVELALKQSKTAGVDWAWTSAKVLETAFGLPGDGKLIARLEAVIANQKLAWERETRAWVLRTGYRIPADEQEKVEALVEGVPVVGKIVGVSRGLGVAYLQTEDGTQTFRIDGEDIIANHTQGRFAPETPILGSRYEDAPALALAAEAQRRKKPAGKFAQPASDARTRQQQIADAYKAGTFGADADGPGAA
ncbi:hypothetical protein CcrRB23_gp475 [Caulobacter phage RB23]|nr:hypothetical protein CcrRB23_gp475 [Caulobacter phage RB23]